MYKLAYYDLRNAARDYYYMSEDGLILSELEKPTQED